MFWRMVPPVLCLTRLWVQALGHCARIVHPLQSGRRNTLFLVEGSGLVSFVFQWFCEQSTQKAETSPCPQSIAERKKLTAFWLSHSVSEFEKPPSEFGHTILFSLHVAPKRKALFQSSFWWQCILESRPSLGRGDGGSEMQGRVCLSWWWGCKRDLTSYETDFRKHSHLL